MNAFYEKMINESPFIPSLPTAANGIRGFYQFQAGNMNNSQEHLNASQNEMSWLNSSFGEKNWLNSSLNLPPEQRYQSLNDMVSKITDDHENMNILNLSFKGKNLHLPFNNAKGFNFNDSMNFKEFEKFFLNESQNRKLFDLNKSMNASNGTKYQQNGNKHMAPHSNVPFSSQTSVQSNNSSNSDSFQPYTNVAFDQSKVFGNGVDMVNGNYLNHPATNQYYHLNGFNQMNNMNYMQLAYLPSYSHHLATLTPDQRNYLIEQQSLLFITIAQAERVMQSQMANQMNQHAMPNISHTNSFMNTMPSPSIESAFLQNKNNHPIPQQQIPMPTYDKSSMFNRNFPSPNRVPNIEQSFQFFQQPSHIFPQHQQPEFKKTEMDSLKANYIPPVTERFDMFSGNKQFRQHRRTGPSNELHVRLEECLHQLSCLEAERKKIEAEFSYLNFAKNNAKQIYNQAIPRLPPNPSRVDRMIVEYLKEHQRIVSLISKFDHLKSTFFYTNIQSTVHNWLIGVNQVQNARRDELMNSAVKQQHPKHLNGHGMVNRSIDEKDVINLAHAINQLSVLTGKTRTLLWCIFQISHIISKPINIPSNGRQTDKQHAQFNFANLNNIKQFLNKTLAIKSDLIEKYN